MPVSLGDSDDVLFALSRMDILIGTSFSLMLALSLMFTSDTPYF